MNRQGKHEEQVRLTRGRALGLLQIAELAEQYAYRSDLYDGKVNLPVKMILDTEAAVQWIRDYVHKQYTRLGEREEDQQWRKSNEG